MQLRVFGCSFGWELWRCMVSISDSTLVALVEAPASPVFSSSSSTTTGSSEIRQQKSRVLVRNALGGHTLTVTSFTGSTYACCFLVLRECSRKGRPSENGLRLRSDPYEIKVPRFIIDIICLVDHDRGFLESLNAPAGTGIRTLTCTPGFLQPVYTFSALVQTCTVCCALGGTSNVGEVRGCHRLNVRMAPWALHLWGVSRICR